MFYFDTTPIFRGSHMSSEDPRAVLREAASILRRPVRGAEPEFQLWLSDVLEGVAQTWPPNTTHTTTPGMAKVRKGALECARILIASQVEDEEEDEETTPAPGVSPDTVA